jgi:hypothetical protein
MEKYVTKLKECFTDLEDSDKGYTDRKKVTTLLEGIRTNNSKMDSIKTIIRVTHPGDFVAACNMLLTQDSEVYKSEGDGDGTRKRNISALNQHSNSGGRGGRGRFRRGGGGRGGRSGRGGRGGRSGRGGCGGCGGCGGRGRGNPDPNHGVDIADVCRDFSPDEWTKLKNAGMLNFIHTQREITNAGGSINNEGLRCIAMLEQQVNPPHPDNPPLIPGTNQQGNDGNANANPSGRGNQNGAHFGHSRYRQN